MKPRHNPFSSDRIDSINYRLLKGTWDNLLERLAAFHYRAAILGPHGSGKTTLLEALGRRLAQSGFPLKKLFLNRESPRFEEPFLHDFFRNLREHDIILFDGADLMRRLEWRRFRQKSRNARGLVITSHRARLLPVLLKCTTTLRLLDDVVGELAGADAEQLAPTTRALFLKHRGNLRDALRELYDIYASRDGFGDLT
jgi:hypothetical protein